MDIGGLYNFVLVLVLIGMVLGVGVLLLDKFMVKTLSSDGNATLASQSINKTITAIYDIPNTWLGLIVTVVAVAIVLTLVIKSFSQGGAR